MTRISLPLPFHPQHYRGVILAYLVAPEKLAALLRPPLRPELTYEQGVVIVQVLYRPLGGDHGKPAHLATNCLVAARSELHGLSGLSPLVEATSSHLAKGLLRLAGIRSALAYTYCEDALDHFLWEAAASDRASFLALDLAKDTSLCTVEAPALGLLPEQLDGYIFSARHITGRVPAIKLSLALGERQPLQVRHIGLASWILGDLVAADEIKEPAIAAYCGSIVIRASEVTLLDGATYRRRSWPTRAS